MWGSTDKGPFLDERSKKVVKISEMMKLKVVGSDPEVIYVSYTESTYNT